MSADRGPVNGEGRTPSLPTWCGRPPGDACYWTEQYEPSPCDSHPLASETPEERLAALRTMLTHPAGPGTHA